jgi:hypothetical protein
MLEKEFEFYQKNQEELVKKYNGRVIVIKDEKVIGDFDSEIVAVNETGKMHELGTFLVQRCAPGTDTTTNTFHSRYAFA